MSVIHREGLAWQGAIQDDGFEKRELGNRGQVNAQVTGLLAELTGDVVAVDIVDLRFGVRF